MRNLTYNKGFTLIELMLVVAIIGILTLIAMPSYQSYTKRTYIMEGLTLAREFKVALSINISEKGNWPMITAGRRSNADINFGAPSSYRGQAVKSIELIGGYYGNYPDGSFPYDSQHNDKFTSGLSRYGASFMPLIKITFNEKVADNGFLILAPLPYVNSMDWICLPQTPSIQTRWLPSKCREEVERYATPAD